MVDSPSDNIQTHKVLVPNSPRGRVDGQKSLKNSKILEKLSPGEGGGTGVGDHLGTCPPISVSIDGTSAKLLWRMDLLKLYEHTKFQVKTQ